MTKRACPPVTPERPVGCKPSPARPQCVISTGVSGSTLLSDRLSSPSKVPSELESRPRVDHAWGAPGGRQGRVCAGVSKCSCSGARCIRPRRYRFFREITFPQPARRTQAHLASRRPQPQLAAFEGQQVVAGELIQQAGAGGDVPPRRCSQRLRAVGLTLENVLGASSRHAASQIMSLTPAPAGRAAARRQPPPARSE